MSSPCQPNLPSFKYVLHTQQNCLLDDYVLIFMSSISFLVGGSGRRDFAEFAQFHKVLQGQ